jgi:DNA replication protein DnaC
VTSDFKMVELHCEVISINGPSYRLKNRLKAIERENEVA